MARQQARNPLYSPRYNDPNLAAAGQNVAGLLLGGESPNEAALAAAEAALRDAQTGAATQTGRKAGYEADILGATRDARLNPAEFLNRGYSTREALPVPLRGKYDTIADQILGGGNSTADSYGKARRANEMSDALDRGHLDFAGPLGVLPGDVAERQAALEGKDLVNQTDNTIGSKFRREQPLVTRLGEAEIGKKNAEAAKPPKGSEPKVMPQAALDKLTSSSSQVDSMNRLTRTFKDEYGGNVIGGAMENTARRLAGDETGQAQWWQDYKQWANQVRHDLFGSALTAPELASFDAANITERMESGEIRKNLARQKQLAESALKKLKGSATANWRNPEAVDAATLSLDESSGDEQAGVPAGIDAETWKHMTPEEQALFK